MNIALKRLLFLSFLLPQFIDLKGSTNHNSPSAAASNMDLCNTAWFGIAEAADDGNQTSSRKKRVRFQQPKQESVLEELNPSVIAVRQNRWELLLAAVEANNKEEVTKLITNRRYPVNLNYSPPPVQNAYGQNVGIQYPVLYYAKTLAMFNLLEEHGADKTLEPQLGIVPTNDRGFRLTKQYHSLFERHKHMGHKEIVDYLKKHNG